MPRKWMEFSDEARRIQRKWYKAMGYTDAELPPELREPGDTRPATAPVATPPAPEPVATTATQPVATTATEPVATTATEPVATTATEPVATELACGGNKRIHDWAQLEQLDLQHPKLNAGQLLALYKPAPGEEPPKKRWVQRTRQALRLMRGGREFGRR